MHGGDSVQTGVQAERVSVAVDQILQKDRASVCKRGRGSSKENDLRL